MGNGEVCVSDIQDSVRQLLIANGERLLQDPLRLEAFLRDLHYDKPKEVSSVLEAVHSGVIAFFPTETIRDCQIMLAQKGGLTPLSAEWAIGVWHELWKEGLFFLETKSTTQKNTVWNGSIEDVLAPFRAVKWRKE